MQQSSTPEISSLNLYLVHLWDSSTPHFTTRSIAILGLIFVLTHHWRSPNSWRVSYAATPGNLATFITQQTRTLSLLLLPNKLKYLAHFITEFSRIFWSLLGFGHTTCPRDFFRLNNTQKSALRAPLAYRNYAAPILVPCNSLNISMIASWQDNDRENLWKTPVRGKIHESIK